MVLYSSFNPLLSKAAQAMLVVSAIFAGFEMSSTSHAKDIDLKRTKLDQGSAGLLAILEPSIATPAPKPQLVLGRTNRLISSTGDPIWNLRLEVPGQPVRHYDAVSGRAHRQQANRDQMGSKAPLPSGKYTLGPVEPLAEGAYPELGPVWIGIEPTFTTGRRVLGIHQDPSAGLNGNSGTLGCIGLISKRDLLELSNLIRVSDVRMLLVED